MGSWSGINISSAVSDSSGVTISRGVNNSIGVSDSSGVTISSGVSDSSGVNNSRGVSDSSGVNNSYGILRGMGVYKSIFCVDFSGKFGLFNKIVDENRIGEVLKKINSLIRDWFPQSNNSFELLLKNGGLWKSTPINKFSTNSKEKMWEGMPKGVVKYLKSLPEFDEKIFFEITGLKS